MHTDDFKLITHGNKSLEFMRGGFGVNSSTFDSKLSFEGNSFRNNQGYQPSNIVPSMKMESINFNNKPGSAYNKTKSEKGSLQNSKTQESFQFGSNLQKT
jgi:hypothetical protein